MLAEKFAKQNGIEYKYGMFLHPEEVLAVCMKWDDFDEFFKSISSWVIEHDSYLKGKWKSRYINIDYITTPNKLLEAAVEWREGNE